MAPAVASIAGVSDTIDIVLCRDVNGWSIAAALAAPFGNVALAYFCVRAGSQLRMHNF